MIVYNIVVVFREYVLTCLSILDFENVKKRKEKITLFIQMFDIQWHMQL